MEVNGKSLEAIAKDIADGFFVLNPLTVKLLEAQHYKPFHAALRKIMNFIRAEGFPSHDVNAIRKRNSRLQRVHSAISVLENLSKEKKIKLL
ncbi:MAG: hypothetical protein HY036_09150 [Nitrospirae bacterium]|nr:hypothetical protein [Nitrospirota bacterium]MBI3352731.1 hypothetical protein [Nitrospirota bacterium]